MPTIDRAVRLNEFVGWVSTHIRGDEKGEAQIYLDRLFKAFGWPGLKEANASCEERIKNDAGGTSFADLVWKPVVVIEMKKRGVDLSKHYRQAFDYWTRLVPGRPRYAVLCNFDEFWVYDFETQLDTPVDVVTLKDLPNRYGPLNFMFPGDISPVFGNHQETVTRQAANKLAACFNSMLKRGIDRPLAQRFTLQMLMSLFAEDIGLLEKYFVTQLLEECRSPRDTFDLLGNLFDAMNTAGGVQGGRFKGVAYFNGGLFALPARVELVAEERVLLKEAAKFNWSKVRPEIFGALFEHSLGKEDRHAFGAHYTSATDIMKIVGPTIVEPWREQIESATTLSRLTELLNRIEHFTVLDPACGSGNFLYIAYREIKRLEARIYERMASEYKSVDANQRPFGFVSARNFFGLDVNPFAIDIAKVTMMLAHKLSIDELHINEAALPLDNLDANFKVSDALVTEKGARTPWPSTDVIIGNPPFLGAKLLKPNYGEEYVNMVRKAYPEVPGMADFCVYWFRRTQLELKECTTKDPVSGRAGLVGTQNVRNNASRIGGLDNIADNGTIIEAVDNQPWSGEANVHVSIVNWVKTKDQKLLPRKRLLWFRVAPISGSTSRKKGASPASKQYELDMREVLHINSSLSDSIDLSKAHSLSINYGVCYTGQYPRYNDGFVLSMKEGQAMLAHNPINAQVVRPFLVGNEVLTDGSPQRYVIDFQTRSILDAQAFPVPFQHLQRIVLPYVQGLAAIEKKKIGKSTGQDQNWLNSWWQHFRARSELIGKIESLNRYLVCSRVTKRPLFAFVSSYIRPGDALTCFALNDDYSFAILHSSAHYEWFHAKCSNMKSDPRYTSESVFDTFPWPQDPSAAQVTAVAKAGLEVRRIRADALSKASGGLRALYRTLDLPGKNPLKDAHLALDLAVLSAFGFSARKDLLEQLLVLNQSVAAIINRGGTATGPGVPRSYPKASALVSKDCIQ